MKKITICFGDAINIQLGVATAHCAIGITAIQGTVTDVSAKGVQITAYTRNDKPMTTWLPLRALIKRSRQGGTIYTQLSPWFTPGTWQHRFMICCQTSSMISA